MKNIFQIYENKSFEVPKALMFGKYSTLSFEAKISWVMFQELSVFDESGLLKLDLNSNSQFVKDEILNELLQYNLIYLKENFMYFNSVEIDNQIIAMINDFENKDIKSSVVPAGTNIKQMKQEEMINKAYFESDNVPQDLAAALQTFSNNVDEANEYFSIVMKAKKKVENEVGMALWIEHDDELNDCIVNSFIRAIRKINHSNIKNRNGYLYKAIYKSISDLMSERHYAEAKPNIIYNWLEER